MLIAFLTVTLTAVIPTTPLSSAQIGCSKAPVQIEAMGHNGFIRGLRQSHISQPWVWYAPTLTGSLPDASHEWMFEAFEAHGIAIAGIDVGESWGSDEGVKVFDAFYDCLTGSWGMSAKPCLLAQSRGGLMLYKWAEKNPDRVSCVAGIHPLTNLESFRKTLETQPGLDEWRNQIVAIHGAGPWMDLSKNLLPLVKQNVPILHIHGTADQPVPIGLNSEEIVRRYRDIGGNAKLIAIDGIGHQVSDCFFKSQSLVEFIITHALQSTKNIEAAAQEDSSGGKTAER